jgi:hypothetical protein
MVAVRRTQQPSDQRSRWDLRDGVLTVRTPKPAGSRPRQIQLKGE